MAGFVSASSASAATSKYAIYPPDDPFSAAPANIADVPAGDVIRSRPVVIRTGEGLPLGFKTHQVLYRTTERSGKAIATSALIIEPVKHRPKTGRKLISYQTAYDGLNAGCDPTYSLRTGQVALQGAETLIIMGLLDRGWTVVTADYEGPDHAWLVGQTTGRGVLDSIRAAERFAPAGLTDGAATPVGMMGYSGGGQATAWANELYDSYAPELNIVGASQGGIAADLPAILPAMDGQLFAGIAFAGFVGLSAGYPEAHADSYLNNRGKYVFRKLRTTNACISDFAGAFPFWQMKMLTTVKDLLAIPVFKQIAQDNSLGHYKPRAPALVYHTVEDEMEGYQGTLALVNKYCKEGTPVRFITGWNGEHASQAFSMPFKAQRWLADRFNGLPLNSNCDKLPVWTRKTK
jgi:hypothetical protein